MSSNTDDPYGPPHQQGQASTAAATSAAPSPQSLLESFQPAFVRPSPAEQPNAPSGYPGHGPAPNARDITAPTHLRIPALGDSKLMGELPSTDPLATLLSKHLPAHMRPPRDLSGSWTQADPFASTAAFDPRVAFENVDEAAVQEAVRTNSWRRIATLARSRIMAYAEPRHDGPPTAGIAEVLEWWSIRLHALSRLRLYSLMHTELTGLWAVLDSTELGIRAGHGLDDALSFDTGSPQKQRTLQRATVAGSSRSRTLASSPLVPFSLRAMKAREAKYRGELTEAIDAHVELITHCKAWIRKWGGAAKRLARQATPPSDDVQKEVAAQVTLWTDRATRLGLITAALLTEAKDYPAAIDLLEPLTASTLLRAVRSPSASQVHLLSHVARLYIQAGSLTATALMFDSARQIYDRLDDDAQREPVSRLVVENAALLATIRGEYASAEAKWREAAEQRAQAGDAEDGLLANDLAVAVFYQGRLQEPVDALERVLASSPSSVTSVEPFLFNLCTLHELRSDDAVRDKRRILALVGQWAGDGSGTSCLKLN
ncbi:uncharacterized protein PFL1_01389 [Pseudozyma flocculosa PF-1]|uniref:uncharacterized protein n=1 Tax=Pseudozyma flocculosa PF-1 TaxID=1277687 RepID=UPI0004560CB3|nr:uncharacterized protein PFL1_01389 [Pseudozyma flocculosa PF-1]EPQ31202.1 hypothetical protein PFL1_01389 [Pseudozyma flocculosa PF-1]